MDVSDYLDQLFTEGVPGFVKKISGLSDPGEISAARDTLTIGLSANYIKFFRLARDDTPQKKHYVRERDAIFDALKKLQTSEPVEVDGSIVPALPDEY